MTAFRYDINRPMKVLLVEDDELLGAGILDALERARYTVEWVRDGVQALTALRGGGIDIAVLDLGLPRLDGMDVLRRAREAGVVTPVLVLSARDTTAQRIGGLDAGADDYRSSPLTSMSCWPGCGCWSGAPAVRCPISSVTATSRSTPRA